jgi:hypothetical protein
MPKDLDAGKDYAIGVFRQLLDEYQGRLSLECYVWKYEGEHLSYTLYLHTPKKSYHIFFASTDLEEAAHAHNTIERNRITAILRQSVESLLPQREK